MPIRAIGNFYGRSSIAAIAAVLVVGVAGGAMIMSMERGKGSRKDDDAAKVKQVAEQPANTSSTSHANEVTIDDAQIKAAGIEIAASRSRMTPSHGNSRALDMARALAPGMNSMDRLMRGVLFIKVIAFRQRAYAGRAQGPTASATTMRQQSRRRQSDAGLGDRA